jgi:predicted AAA+ superfamily ATPase
MIRRNIQRALADAMADTPVVLLNGARQTGKTTLVQSLASASDAAYYSLDDSATLALASADPAGFVRAQSGPVAIDEIQKAPALFPAIKLAVDRGRKPGRFLLTGSANVLALPRLSESLVGRMQVVPLYPFSAGELANVEESFIARLFQGTLSRTKAQGPRVPLADRMIRGGFPEAVERTDVARRSAWFASYVSTLLQRDVRDLAKVDGLVALPNLLRLLAARGAGLLNLASLARDMALPHTTVTRYLALLETVFLIHRLPAWSANLGHRLVKAPKLHLVDVGLASHLLGVDAARLRQDPSLFGHVLESYVASELRKQLSWAEPETTLFHFRTSAGLEVDLLLERPDGAIAAVEVKLSATIGPSDFAGLEGLRTLVGKRFRAGAVVYTGDQILPFGNHLWAVPIETLWSTR